MDHSLAQSPNQSLGKQERATGARDRLPKLPRVLGL